MFRNSLMLFLAIVFLTGATACADDRVTVIRETGKAFTQVAKKVSPAVVSIRVEKEVQTGAAGPRSFQFGTPFDDFFFNDDFLRKFFRQPDQTPEHFGPPLKPRTEKRVIGQGSGFLVSAGGYIITNNHVIGNADTVWVHFQDGEKRKAKIIGTDKGSDLAVIKVDGKGYEALKLGDSDKLEIGEWVLAIGNPFGLSHTLTAGIVSAKGRNGVGITDYEDFIQTDAAINPGNSGGPLVNMRGEVVGVNTAIFSKSGGYMGIGFAIPVNMVKQIKDQLIEGGKVSRGFLGVRIQELSSDLSEEFGVEHGVLIASVDQGSAAEKAGVKAGDVVMSFDGKATKSVANLRNLVAMEKPGSTHKLELMRGRKKLVLSVTIGSRSDYASAGAGSPAKGFGIVVDEINEEHKHRFRLDTKEGLVVTSVEPGSPAQHAGIEPGTIIMEVNREIVRSREDFDKAIGENSSRVLLRIRRGGVSRFVVLKTK